MSKTITVLSGSAAPFVFGLGIAQVLHGHSWGGLLIGAGLGASMPYFMLMGRSAPHGRTTRAEDEAGR
jgi:hypothetical protein